MVTLSGLLLATTLFPDTLAEGAPLVLGAAWVAGVLFALVMQFARKPFVPLLLGGIVLEELCVIACACGPYPEPLVDGWHAPVFIASFVAAGVLLVRLPLPEALFPVRGRWLRTLLAALALLGLMN